MKETLTPRLSLRQNSEMDVPWSRPIFYGLKIWCSLLLTSHSWVKHKQFHGCETLKLNQELRKILLSLYQRKVSSGITQPPVSEWRDPTLSSLKKVQPNTGSWAPRVHSETSGLSTSYENSESPTFWDGEQVLPVLPPPGLRRVFPSQGSP